MCVCVCVCVCGCVVCVCVHVCSVCGGGGGRLDRMTDREKVEWETARGRKREREGGGRKIQRWKGTDRQMFSIDLQKIWFDASLNS